MINFYHGTVIPDATAQEGIYFITNNNKACSIYAKVSGKNPVLYAEVNEVTSNTINDLWDRIGNSFVAKTFQVAGMDMDSNITVDMMKNALQLKSLAYKNEATGTLTDYVTEVQGVNYTPTGRVEVITGKNKISITSTGQYTPKGEVTGSVVPKGSAQLQKQTNGVSISGHVSTPEVTIQTSQKSIKQIASVGTLPTYTPAQYVAPKVNPSQQSFATQGMIASVNENSPNQLNFSWASTQNAIVDIGFNQGNYTAAAFNPGTLPEIDETLSVVEEIQGTEVSTPIFTGDAFGVVFTGEESNITATFAGEEEVISVEGEFEESTVQSVTFTGVEQTITPTLTKENKTITVF